ncbi:putative lipid scramblase CLPTM1 [Oscarella lobularis]|uniref:putative lipid scramblase CLPTM1 n=1 Tax=Oscarella lobularis TaxID=121494 RepID=UPI00331422DF
MAATPSNDAQAVEPASNESNDQENTNNQQPAQPQRQGSFLQGFIWRLVIFWFISNLFRRGGTPGRTFKNLFEKGQQLNLHVFVNEKENFTYVSGNDGDLFWFEEDLEYGNWEDGENGDGSRYISKEIALSDAVQKNASLYLHVFIVKSGFPIDPSEEQYNQLAVVNESLRLNRYKKRRIHKTVNLITGEADVSPGSVQSSNKDEWEEAETISYWHPNITVNLLDDHTPWSPGSVPPPIDQFVKFDNKSSGYYPILYINDFWNLASEYMPINETTPKVTLSLTFSPLTLFRLQMYLSQKTKSQWASYMGEAETTDHDEDTLKLALIETNPYLLGLTIIVSIVHTVFEFLAFKNDVQFWRSRKSLEGLSVRSVFFNVFQSVVVLLYVFDNDTNIMVVFSCFIGLLIELWKVTKVVDIKIDFQTRLFGLLPKISIKDKSTYVQSATRQYDMMAFKYLSVALFPLFFAYGGYSLIYHEHKGWYSFVLSMCYGFLLTFGFIMMTPQLFINYKLKSVAHLPWRMLTYKALNTFIDDLFAFVIRMPMMYRIGCLRDDVIFLIYVYQRWIYPVDPKRFNEFGTSGEKDEAASSEIEGSPGQPEQPVADDSVVAGDDKVKTD